MIRRSLCAVALLAGFAAAAPTLTTIQDVLYKADGTRFNGTLSISWSSFQAADNSDIVMQTTHHQSDRRQLARAVGPELHGHACDRLLSDL